MREPLVLTSDPLPTSMTQGLAQFDRELWKAVTHLNAIGRLEDDMSGPVIRGVAQTLRESLRAATAAASALGEDAKSAVAELNDTVSQGTAVVKDVRDATAEVKAALGLSTNGGPALDDAVASPTSSPDVSGNSPASSAPTMSAERTPIGFVARRG